MGATEAHATAPSVGSEFRQRHINLRGLLATDSRPCGACHDRLHCSLGLVAVVSVDASDVLTKGRGLGLPVLHRVIGRVGFEGGYREVIL